MGGVNNRGDYVDVIAMEWLVFFFHACTFNQVGQFHVKMYGSLLLIGVLTVIFHLVYTVYDCVCEQFNQLGSSDHTCKVSFCSPDLLPMFHFIANSDILVALSGITWRILSRFLVMLLPQQSYGGG